MAGFLAELSHSHTSPSIRLRVYLPDVPFDRVSLARVWVAPVSIAFKFVSEAVMAEAEDDALSYCYELRLAQDARFPTVLNKIRASRCSVLCRAARDLSLPLGRTCS